MASHAYLDKNRTNLVSADKESKINKKTYYCLNPNCNARMFLKSDQSTVVPKHFSAFSSSPHIKNCWNKINHNNLRKKNYNPNLFIFKDIINEYMNGDFNKKLENRLSTIAGIYYMCKTKSIDDKYGDTEIWKILADTRSKKIYTNGIFGPHLIECLFNKYNSKNQIIEFNYPIDSPLNPQHKLQVHIPSLELFKDTLNRVYNLSNQTIVIVGEWNFLKTTLSNKYQIYIP